jgi:hypothetical protein
MPEYPKFKARVMDRVVLPAIQQTATPGYAVVLDFNAYNNSCTVATAMPGSDEIGQVYQNVPAPVQVGVQAVAPSAGIMCWLAFRDGTRTDPYISHFFNWSYTKYSYQKQYTAKAPVPSYMLSM